MNSPTRILAIDGAAPIFDTPRHVGRPNTRGREKFLRLAEEILDRNWLTNDGPVVREFEDALAGRLGVAHVITVCNATVGLQLVASALELSGEIIMPSFTFVATAHAMSWQGLKPVFVDIDPVTHNLDPILIEGAITESTCALLPVHLWGRAADAHQIDVIARTNGLSVFYDAAHSFGVSWGEDKVGGFGDAEVFSFHATKFFNSFEGGAITTNDPDLARRLRLARNFGFSGVDSVSAIGINGKMSEICAAMGLANLEHIDEVVAVNRRNHETYAAELATVGGISVMPFDPSNSPNFQYVTAEVLGDDAAAKRDWLIKVLEAENVLARRYFWPGCHRVPPYVTSKSAHLPVTEDVCDRILVLPTGTAMTPEEIEAISGVLASALAEK